MSSTNQSTNGGVTEPDQYIFDEWSSMCAKANKNLHSDCPLIEDEVLVEMYKYVQQLETELEKHQN